MNRRGFLGLLGCAAVAPAALVEVLEPKRTIILPPRGGWPVETIARYTYKTYAIGFNIEYAELGERYAKALAESLVEMREQATEKIMGQIFNLPQASKIYWSEGNDIQRWKSEYEGIF